MAGEVTSQRRWPGVTNLFRTLFLSCTRNCNQDDESTIIDSRTESNTQEAQPLTVASFTETPEKFVLKNPKSDEQNLSSGIDDEGVKVSVRQDSEEMEIKTGVATDFTDKLEAKEEEAVVETTALSEMALQNTTAMKTVSCPENLGLKQKSAGVKVRMHPADFMKTWVRSEPAIPAHVHPIMSTIYNLPNLRRLRGETITPIPYDKVPVHLWPMIESMGVSQNKKDESQFRLQKVYPQHEMLAVRKRRGAYGLARELSKNSSCPVICDLSDSKVTEMAESLVEEQIDQANAEISENILLNGRKVSLDLYEVLQIKNNGSETIVVAADEIDNAAAVNDNNNAAASTSDAISAAAAKDDDDNSTVADVINDNAASVDVSADDDNVEALAAAPATTAAANDNDAAAPDSATDDDDDEDGGNAAPDAAASNNENDAAPASADNHDDNAALAAADVMAASENDEKKTDISEEDDDNAAAPAATADDGIPATADSSAYNDNSVSAAVIVTSASADNATAAIDDNGVPAVAAADGLFAADNDNTVADDADVETTDASAEDAVLFPDWSDNDTNDDDGHHNSLSDDIDKIAECLAIECIFMDNIVPEVLTK